MKKSVGLYSVAITITGLWSFIPIAFLDSARPLIMEAKAKNQTLYIKRLKQLYAFIIWMSIAYAVGMCIFSKIIILILYGEKYLAAQSALIITVWYCIFHIWVLLKIYGLFVNKR